MAYQTPITIKAALDAVWKNEFVLPAIQREFVWGPEKICSLFDSLMQGFPVGSFLFWKIEQDTAKKFTFSGLCVTTMRETTRIAPLSERRRKGRLLPFWMANSE